MTTHTPLPRPNALPDTAPHPTTHGHASLHTHASPAARRTWPCRCGTHGACGPGHQRCRGRATLDEVRAAQRLRFDAFAGEMGARLSTTVPGHDIDLFDNYCEHLLVRDVATAQVIGTYRRARHRCRPSAWAAPTATPSST